MEAISYQIRKERHMWIKAFAILLLIFASSSCSYLMPPQKIPMDRRNYIDAVSTSWKEQLLSNLVKLRYGDTLTFLEMTSITTGYELGAGATAGYTHGSHPGGAWGDFRNLFGLGGAITYLDKPTISYAPMRGEALTKVLIKPIPAMQLLRSHQVGWRPDYIFSCCVKSLNDLNNPWNPDFFAVANLITDLRKEGVLRITIEEEKAPTKYDVTLHTKDIIFKEKKKAGTGAGSTGKPKQAKKSGQTTGNDQNDKENKEEPSIALLVLDRNRAKEGELKKLKNLLWPDYDARIKEGQYLYVQTCQECHGEPKYSPHKSKAVNFNDPHFWVGELDQKIPHAVTCGKGEMKEIEMKPGQIKAVIAFIKKAFGKYEVYSIIDGNESPPQKDPYCDKIVMRTRSIMQVFIYLSQFIEVPDKHLPDKENRAEKRSLPDQPLDGPDGDLKFKIDCKKEHPSDTFVAVRYNNYWFFIDDKNFDSKSVFSGIAGILSMAEPGTKEGTPVLTLPVQ